MTPDTPLPALHRLYAPSAGEVCGPLMVWAAERIEGTSVDESAAQGNPAALAPREAEQAGPLIVETAAIRIGNAVFTLPRPNRHHNIMWWLGALGIGSHLMHEQGFVLSDGTYANRRFAARVALRAGQVAALTASPNLYSEDLWDGGYHLPRPDQIRRLTADTPSSEEQSSQSEAKLSAGNAGLDTESSSLSRAQAAEAKLGEAVKQAYLDGFLCGICQESWEDMHDWAALVADNYSKTVLSTIQQSEQADG